MRVTNSMIYGSVIFNTNRALGNYYDLSEQNASQRKVNRPSDDPAGTAAILGLRSHVSELDQYLDNINTARGYLTTADDALNTMSELTTSARELAEQAATGTLSADQRLMVADEMRQLQNEMLAVANTEYLDGSIFAGQNSDSDAYVHSLYADVVSPSLAQGDVVAVTGAAERSVMVEFTDSGTVGGGVDIGYRYSEDGGQTWTNGVLAAGDDTLNLGSCNLELAAGAAVTGATDPAGQTSLVVRPSATYLGDAQDGAAVTQHGASPVSGSARGVFNDGVTVRIDAATDITAPITYSYSTDGGSTWVEGNVADDGVLAVPGGVLELAPDPGTALTAGEQFVITPERAEVSVAISDDGEVTINNVGKDIFGGLYQASGEDSAAPVEGANLFETVGKLIGALETNDQDAIAACLEELTAAQEQVLRGAADVGAREVRLDNAEASLALRRESDTNLMSDIEDADMTTLMTRLQAAEATYRSVVETSASIMQLSIVNLT